MKLKNFIINILVNPINIRRLDKLLIYYIRFFFEWNKFNHLVDTNKASLIDLYPQLWDRTKNTSFDAHYIYQALWATDRLKQINPKFHVDISSQIQFATTIGIMFPTIYLDYRPVKISFNKFLSIGATIENLPFENNSINSLSSLHVIEHIGLGRYGDKINPAGHLEGIKEISRVMANNGNVLISTPVGIERTCFNAHRIFNPLKFLKYFTNFRLLEFSYIDDEGIFHNSTNPEDAVNQNYACGMYWLKKGNP